MPDDIDKAQEFAAMRLDIALTAHRFHRRPAFTDGSHGICIDCIQPIPPERLSAVPGAVRCVECEDDFERKGDRP